VPAPTVFALAGLAAVNETVKVPRTYKEAMRSPQAAQWKAACDDEMASLISNQTWEVTPAPPGRSVIGSRWVFALKRGPDGEIVRYKARLVAKGFSQVPGRDYDEVYAPVATHASIRAVMAMVAMEDLELRQLDIKTAFLNGVLEQRVYMQQPEGYHTGASGDVCYLYKCVYGLKQAPRVWYQLLKNTLAQYGFTPSRADPCIFIRYRSDGTWQCILLIYVDDVLTAARTLEEARELEAQLADRFELRALGPAAHFVGMKVMRDRTRRTLTLSLAAMTRRLIEEYGLSDCKPKAIPMDPGAPLHKLAPGDEPLSPDYSYPALVGSLLYLSLTTRPDIAFAVGVLTRFTSAPSKAHWLAAKAVVRYLSGTSDLGLTFAPSGSAQLTGYCDADYAGELDGRRSCTGYAFLLHGGPISWKSQLQKTVAQSTAESEYMAAASAVKEAVWLRTLLEDLDIPVDGPVQMYTDNQACLSFLKDHMTSPRAKHIDIRYHAARQKVEEGVVHFEYLQTSEMLADIFTKALPAPKFKYFCGLLGLKG